MDKSNYIKTGLIPSAFSMPVYHTIVDDKIYFDFDRLDEIYRLHIQELKIIEHENNQ
tara:strand:- start:534 stop:704 length:171 start_codon:yes stop_codon:yes gene_type:complete